MDQMRAAPTRNSDYPWDAFDPFDYLAHNYSRLRADDEEILALTQAWFAEHADRSAAADDAAGAHGIDVGCGPNLYPGLAMLPLCRSVTLVDYSHSNIAWLRSHLTHCGDIWRPYWERISPGDCRGGFEQARGWLAERGRIQHGSVFDLPPRSWDLGTMFFVAESITADYAEFDRAVRGFLRALRPGAPFAAAFMEDSQGYEIAGVPFPAVGVGETELRDCLADRAAEARIHRIPTGAEPLRPGYSGMLLALGITT
jgi:hypothetical protein